MKLSITDFKYFVHTSILTLRKVSRAETKQQPLQIQPRVVTLSRVHDH